MDIVESIKKDVRILLADLTHRNLVQILKLYEILIEIQQTGVRLNKREIFYRCVNVFKSQKRLQGVINRAKTILNVNERELGIAASLKGLVYGKIKFVINGDVLDCNGIIPDMACVSKIFLEVRTVVVIEKDSVFSLLVALIKEKYQNTAKTENLKCVQNISNNNSSRDTEDYVEVNANQLKGTNPTTESSLNNLSLSFSMDQEFNSKRIQNNNKSDIEHRIYSITQKNSPKLKKITPSPLKKHNYQAPKTDKCFKKFKNDQTQSTNSKDKNMLTGKNKNLHRYVYKEKARSTEKISSSGEIESTNKQEKMKTNVYENEIYHSTRTGIKENLHRKSTHKITTTNESLTINTKSQHGNSKNTNIYSIKSFNYIFDRAECRNESAEHSDQKNVTNNFTVHSIHPHVLNLLKGVLFVCGKGYPCANTLYLLRMIEKSYPDIPIYGLFDFDPFGLHIYFVYKNGTQNSPPVSSMTRIGVDAEDIFKYKIDPNLVIPFNRYDLRKLNSLQVFEELSNDVAFLRGLGGKMEMEILFSRYPNFIITYIYRKIRIKSFQ